VRAPRGDGQALERQVGRALVMRLIRVRMVVQKIELERTLIADAGSHRDEQELAVGPFLIDLQGSQLDSGINKVFTVTTEAGDYKEITFKVHRLEGAEAGSDLALGEMTGFSIRIEGTRNGTAFTFTSSLDEEQEREGNFTLHSGANNIAFNVDPSGWFMNGTTPLDPSDPTARAKIESNIKASIDTFKDDDNHGHR
jgi:hypothetical protein